MYVAVSAVSKRIYNYRLINFVISVLQKVENRIFHIYLFSVKYAVMKQKGITQDSQKSLSRNYM